MDANQPIIDNQAIIDNAKESIKKTTSEIDGLISGMDRGTISVGEAVPQIQQAFACLEENTKQILDKIYDNITRALAGERWRYINFPRLFDPGSNGLDRQSGGKQQN